ncbi:MAG TPA: asparagine synthase (glutamine-hydrolyzing) [Woeseiaceae bacterium]|nr:asparagine synthase (glutamine-hydrolyzing) [Woeseiaceae bacterium]
MCGITGIWTQNAAQHRIKRELTEAVASLRHRGPDDEGIWLSGTGVALGHTRLSILDLSELGHQPMISEDERFVLVYNGEIYNFAEIREKLVRAGHGFHGSGDTEVILHAFAEWGSDAVHHFIGMFAIALWDQRERRLELVRDRVGVKPLYFGWDGKTLCFGSELKALRAFGHWKPEIDLEALGEFLQYGYIAADRTIYKGIRKLAPGHRLVMREGQEPRVEPYWSILDVIGQTQVGSDAELEQKLEELLINSFRYRMVSDVPVGVYLSGGIDSSLLTAILTSHHDQEIRTFTIGFSEDSHDESRWARKVAHHCGSRHTEYILGVREALDIARDWGRLFDEPFGDSSGIPTLLVSRLARQDVKVVLSADGGDELLSGYKVYASVLGRLGQLERIPRWGREALAAAMSPLSPRLPEARNDRVALSGANHGDFLRRLRRFRSMLRHPTPGSLMEMYLSSWETEEINRMIGNYRSPRRSADSYPGHPATRISLWDFHHYLPEDILTKVDRTTMAVSLEGREPLLDHRLVELALTLPPHLRRGHLGPKHLLRSILYRYVPRELVERPKQGFAIPLESWLKTDLRALVNDYLAPDRIRRAGVMDPVLVRRSVDRFFKGDMTLATPLWLLLAFEMWRENWGT